MSLIILSRESVIDRRSPDRLNSMFIRVTTTCQRCLVIVENRFLFFDRSLLDTNVVTETCDGWGKNIFSRTGTFRSDQWRNIICSKTKKTQRLNGYQYTSLTRFNRIRVNALKRSSRKIRLVVPTTKGIWHTMMSNTPVVFVRRHLRLKTNYGITYGRENSYRPSARKHFSSPSLAITSRSIDAHTVIVWLGIENW